MDKYWDAAASMAEKADREIAKLRSERDKLRDALVCVNTLVIPIDGKWRRRADKIVNVINKALKGIPLE